MEFFAKKTPGHQCTKDSERFFLAAHKKILLLRRVSLIRPAPAELPQDRKIARVGGRSGAISNLPIFYFRQSINKH